tara:strand:- start:3118 stop:3276 length:159 start_codon:yes stop_codon:yes gene_type:complete
MDGVKEDGSLRCVSHDVILFILEAMILSPKKADTRAHFYSVCKHFSAYGIEF